LDGKPIRVTVRPSLGPYHASSSIRKRFILLDSGVLVRRGEFERILVHELFHFVWVRLGNSMRHEWEAVLREEIVHRIRGELGWSSEWRKNNLAVRNARVRDARWRRYACESFCDTAAWMFARIGKHDEFTLTASARKARRSWFWERISSINGLPV